MNQIPVFIVYNPRSGSTLLFKMLMQNPNIMGFNANELLFSLCQPELAHSSDNTFIWDNLMKGIGMQRLMTGHNLEEMRNYFIKSAPLGIRERYEFVMNKLITKPQSTVILDKSIRNARVMDNALTLWVNSKIIYISRDPRSITLSVLNKKTAKRKNKLSIQVDESDWNYNTFDIYTHSMTVNENIKKIAQFADTAPKDRFLTIRYEDLIVDLHETLQRICEFLRVPYSKDMEFYHEKEGPNTKAHFLLNKPPDVSRVYSYRALSAKSLYIMDKATRESQSFQNYEEIYVKPKMIDRVKCLAVSSLIRMVKIKNFLKVNN